MDDEQTTPTTDDPAVDLSQPPAEEPPASPWDDLAAYQALPRLGGLLLSPDGSRLVVSVSRLTHDGTAFASSLTEVDLAGGAPRRLTRSVEGESAAAFLRDGSLLFTSRRALPKDGDDADTVKALWCLPAAGEAYVLARRDGGWEHVTAARAADVAVLGVPFHRGAADEAADAERRKERKTKRVAALLHDGYPIRYWDHDLGQESTRLLAVDGMRGDATLTAADYRPLVPGDEVHLAGPYSITDDGATLVCGWRTARPRGVTTDAVVAIDVATGTLRVLAEGDQAGDETFGSPVVDGGGRFVACVRDVSGTATTAPELRLHLIDLASGERRDLAPQWDRWAHPVGFSPDADVVYATCDEDGDHPLFAVGVADGSARRITGAGAFSSVVISPDGAWGYAVRTAYDCPGEVVRIELASGRTEALDCGVSYPPLPGRLERVETTTDDGTRVAGYLCLPDAAAAERPAPLALWIHGGPLGSWNAWSWRWCPWLLVSQGYAVVLPDPALSTGYGRSFIQRGWGSWGDKPYTDVMALTDAVVAREDVDEARTCAMGGSFGGYMANWVATHTDRFKAIVTHASLWNLESFGPTTDAAWYWAREMSPEMQAQNSPHRYAENITTPMLVVHGDRDYRVPIGEGLALWWTLNHLHEGDPADLPHRFLYFPDENHWVLTPQHATLWYQTVRAFLAHHVLGQPFVTPELL